MMEMDATLQPRENLPPDLHQIVLFELCFGVSTNACYMSLKLFSFITTCIGLALLVETKPITLFLISIVKMTNFFACFDIIAACNYSCEVLIST